MSLRFAISDIAKGFLDTVTKEIQRPIAKAATAAIREAGEIAKRDGRASIAACGFSRKWQNALRVNIYPPQGDSMRPAAFIYHKIRHAGLQKVDLRVAKVESTLQQVANVLVLAARQDERLISIERWLDRLEQSPGHR